MNKEADTTIDLRPQYRFIRRHVDKAVYALCVIAGAGLSQLAQNIDVTLAIGLAVRIVCEITGAALFLGLLWLGAWTAIHLITGKE